METPVLEGPGVRLEPLSSDHLPALESIAFDPSIWRHMIFCIKTPQSLREWVDRAMTEPNTLAWATIRRAHGDVPDCIVGATRYLDLNLAHRTVEVGHTWLTEPIRGTRVNAEAKFLQLTYAFETLGLNRVAFKTHIANHRSQAALKSIGAHPEGTFRNHFIMPDGSLRDSTWFSIIRSEWPGVKELLQHRLNAPA